MTHRSTCNVFMAHPNVRIQVQASIVTKDFKPLSLFVWTPGYSHLRIRDARFSRWWLQTFLRYGG